MSHMGMSARYRPGVLLVCSDDALGRRWSTWLQDAGFVTTSCRRGPGGGRCPRAGGGRCPLQDAVDVVVADDRDCVGPGHPPWAVLVRGEPEREDVSASTAARTVPRSATREQVLASVEAALGVPDGPVLAWKGRFRERPVNPLGPAARPPGSFHGRRGR